MIRLDAPEVASRIGMDDVGRALAEMPPVARSLAEASGHTISEMFLQNDESTSSRFEGNKTDIGANIG